MGSYYESYATIHTNALSFEIYFILGFRVPLIHGKSGYCNCLIDTVLVGSPLLEKLKRGLLDIAPSPKQQFIQTCILMWKHTIQQKQYIYIKFSGGFRSIFVSKSGSLLIILFFRQKSIYKGLLLILQSACPSGPSKIEYRTDR